MKIQLPPLHPLQQAVAEDATRFKVVCCGRRWGKTYFAAAYALTHAMRGRLVWWVAPTYAQSGVGWRLLRLLVQMVPGGAEHRAERYLALPGGGTIWFKTADDPDKLRGESLGACVIDEAAFCPEAVWTDALRPALSDQQGEALFISTPNRAGDWFHRAFQEGESDATDWRSWHFPTSSSPFIPAKEIEAARRSLPALVFQREYLAEFVTAAGARVRREWLELTKPPADLQLAMGVDLAISTKSHADYTAYVVMGRDKSGKAYVVHADRIRSSFHEAARWLAQGAANYGVTSVGVEAVSYQAAMVQELQRATSLNVRAIKPNGDKLERFAPLEARIQQGTIAFAPTLPEWFLDELCAFPVASHDDGVDAMVYAWQTLAAGGQGSGLTQFSMGSWRR